MRSRDGFTMTELLVVLILAGIIGGVAMIRAGKMLAGTRVQRAAAIISTDLKLAYSVAARSRQPVKISIDTAGKVIRVVNSATWTTVYSERHFGPGSEIPVEYMAATDTSLLVFPNGLASGQIDVTVRAGEDRRLVHMTRAGMVRVSQP